MFRQPSTLLVVTALAATVVTVASGWSTLASFERSMGFPIRISFRSYANCFAQSRQTT
jgi:hypothetical protein